MQTQASPLVITSEAFREGYESAVNDTIHRFDLPDQPTEAIIVDIITNLTEIAVEGWLTEELVQRDGGMIAGWLVRCLVHNGQAR